MNESIHPLYINLSSPFAKTQISSFISPQNKKNNPAYIIRKKHLLKKIYPFSQSFSNSQNPSSFQSISQNKLINNIIENYLDAGSHSQFLLDLISNRTTIINRNDAFEHLKNLEKMLNDLIIDKKKKDLINLTFSEIKKIIFFFSEEEKQNFQEKNFKNPSKFPEILTLIEKGFQIYRRIQKPNNLLNEIEIDLELKLKNINDKIRELHYGDFAYNFWENIQKHFIENEEKILNYESEKIAFLKERKQTEFFMNKNYIIGKGETEELLKNYQITGKTNREDLKEKLNEFDSIYRIRIKELQTEINLLQEQINNKDKNINTLENKIILMNSNEKKVIKIHKGTQINTINKVNDIKKYDNMLIKMIKETKEVFSFRFETSISLINLIISERLLNDQKNILEGNKLIFFKDYLIEWFLKKIGNYSVIQKLISDFLISINSEKLQRFQLFRRLLGIEQGENLRKRSFYESPETLKIVLKIAYLLKLSKKVLNPKEYDTFSPLFPMLNNDQISYTFDEITVILNQLVKDGELTEENFEEIKNNLYKQIMGNREAASRPGNISPGLFDKLKHNILEKSKVIFDFFIEFLLDFLYEKFNKKIEIIISGISTIQISKKNELFYDDFYNILIKNYPKNSKVWIDRIYVQLNLIHRKNAKISETIDLISGLFLTKSPELNDYLSYYKEDNKIIGSNLVDALNLGSINSNEKKSQKKNSINLISTNIQINKEKNSYFSQPQFKFENFDIVNNIIILNEFYQMMEVSILKEEIKNETLFLNDQILKKEMGKLPNARLLKNAKNFSLVLNENDRLELIEIIKKCWSCFRLVIDCLTF